MCNALKSFARPLTMSSSQFRRLSTVTFLNASREEGDGLRGLLDALDAPLNIDTMDVTLENGPIAKNVIESLSANKYALAHRLAQTNDIELRRQLDIYGQVVHAKNYLPACRNARYRLDEIDFVIVRESVQGGLMGLEHTPAVGVSESLKIITRDQTSRVAELACKIARKRQRRKLSIVHKANIMKLTDGLFLRTCQQKAEQEFPNVDVHSIIVDNCAMQMVSRPQQFDVLVMPNDYGPVMIGVAGGLVSAPILPSVSHAKGFKLFEPASPRSAVGSTTAFLLSVSQLLEKLDMDDQAELLAKAINDAYHAEPSDLLSAIVKVTEEVKRAKK